MHPCMLGTRQSWIPSDWPFNTLLQILFPAMCLLVAYQLLACSDYKILFWLKTHTSSFLPYDALLVLPRQNFLNVTSHISLLLALLSPWMTHRATAMLFVKFSHCSTRAVISYAIPGKRGVTIDKLMGVLWIHIRKHTASSAISSLTTLVLLVRYVWNFLRAHSTARYMTPILKKLGNSCSLFRMF
jgi:exosortase/archaeosortase